MGRAREISKVFSANTSLSTDSEVSASYLTLASASTTYQTKASAGLTLLNTTSFTSQSAVSVDNVFSATYHYYKMIINYQVSAAFPKIRLRASGSDATSADYSWQSFQFSNTTIDVRRNTGDTTWDISASVGNNVTQFIELELYNPFASSLTWGFAKSYQSGSGQFNNFRMNTSTSYDGFTLYPSTSTMTGALSIFGFNK